LYVKKEVGVVKKPFGLIVVFLFIAFILLGSGLVCAECNAALTPKLQAGDYFEVGEGERFEYSLNITNMLKSEVYFTYAFFGQQPKGFGISNDGVISFTPAEADVGVSRVAVIAAKDSCADTLIITFRIFDRPGIISFSPQNESFMMSQTDKADFMIRADDTDENETLAYAWLMDFKPMNDSEGNTSISFTPGYGVSGVHNITAKVTDSHNLSSMQAWYVQVAKVNRPPVLIANITNFIIFMNTAAGAYNLNDYFVDPDGGELKFGYRQASPAFEAKGVVYANISVFVDKTGFVTYDPVQDTKSHAYFVFTAYDLFNASADSNIVRIDVASTDKYQNLNNTSPRQHCGDNVCSLGEDCNTCPYDCGDCPNEQTGCKPEWNCTEWSPCWPAGFQTRDCTDINLCGDNRTKPDEVKKCIYNATCKDGLKNGIEEGVDCGGPCLTCPDCSDWIQNQGEEGVDCGGPCENRCPSCNDSLKNQNESDIDCGGPCKSCEGGKICFKNKDCESLRCDLMKCTFANCSDTIRNQGEEGIDCGGKCPNLCGNCSDGLQNRGEEGVDCGGMCKPCASCSDNIKNNGELLVDCGGKCRACVLNDFFKSYFIGFIILFIVAGIAVLGLFINLLVLFLNPDKARTLYDSNAAFTFIVGMNRFCTKCRKLRKKAALINDETMKRFIAELTEIGNMHDGNKPLHDEIIKIYTAILGLPEEFDNNIFNMKLRASHISLFLKILFAGYYKKAEILIISSFVSAEEKLDLVLEMKFLLTELAKG